MDQTTMSAAIPDSAIMQQVRSNINGTKGWLKFIGVLNLIMGILTALGLVGILYIFIGIIMMNAGSRGKDYVERGDLNALVEYHAKLKTLFTIQGVLAIIGLVGLAIWFIVMIIILAVGGFASMY